MHCCTARRRRTNVAAALLLLLVSSQQVSRAVGALFGGSAAHTQVSPFHPHPVYTDAWVKQHVVLTYAPETTRDGLGAQAFRVLGVHALAQALGLGYLHAAPECIGHVGALATYQNKDCNSSMLAADHARLARMQRVLALPDSEGVSSADVSNWHVERLDDIVMTWDLLANATQAAVRARRPTLIKLARVQALLCQSPDVFLALPQLRPPAEGQQQLATSCKPWLLNSVRVAVHMRRGDITRNVKHFRRLLPVDFYINVLKQLTQALSSVGADVAVEVYSERPTSPSNRRELLLLRRAFPDATLLLSTDEIWTWHQMATADVIVQSLSMFSVVPALLNPTALVVGPKPEALDHQPMSAMHMAHWFSALDHNGTLPAQALQQLQRRFAGQQGRAAAAAVVGQV